MALPRRKQKRLLHIQRRVQGTDSAGQPLDGWQDVLTAWCNPSGQNGMSAIGQMQGDVAASISKYSLRIDYRPDIDASMRALLGGAPYDIVQVRHDHEGRQWTDLVCELGGNDG